MIDNEIPKYRKKKGRKSQAARRSDHKHNYLPAKLNTYYSWMTKTFITRGYYCSICGKWKQAELHWNTNQAEEWDKRHPEAPIVSLTPDHSSIVDFQKIL